MTSPLLISEPPLQVLPTLATLIGLNEAIFIQQLHYWLEKPSAHVIEGKRWVYNTIAQWQEQLPFWSERTLKRIVADLAESGLVLRKNFNKDRRDRTWWYTIDYKVLEAIYDEGYSKIRYGTLQSDKLAPSTPGQDGTMQSDKLAPSLMYTEITPEITPENTHKNARACEEDFSDTDTEEFPSAGMRRPPLQFPADYYEEGTEQPGGNGGEKEAKNALQCYGCGKWSLFTDEPVHAPNCPLETEAEEEQPGNYGGENPWGGARCPARHAHEQCLLTEGHLNDHDNGRWRWRWDVERPDAVPDPMDTLQPVATSPATSGEGGAPAPEACRAYQPGFACLHMRAAVDQVSRVFGYEPAYVETHLGALIDEFSETDGKPRLWRAAHQFSLEDIVDAARAWVDDKQRRRLPLFFSQIASTLANAQSQGDRAARPLTAEEERAREKTKRMVARIEAENQAEEQRKRAKHG